MTRLALSTAALPGRTPAEVARACAPRGLAGIEIVLDAVPSESTARAWRALDVPVIALRAETGEVGASPELARIAGILEAPVVLAPDRVALARIPALARAYASHGATLLLGHRTRLAEVRRAAALVETVGSVALGLAWEIRPLDDDLSRATQLLIAAEPHMLHVRLHGGGPEQRAHDGRGVGEVFVQLALSRYAGAIALAPSCDASPELWARWAAGSSPSGCGSRGGALVAEGRLELDVRAVEPKDRIDAVLSSYDVVGPGGTLGLIVDHDPDCMSHLLTATQPEGSFRFEYLERGPETWRVDVVRRS